MVPGRNATFMSRCVLHVGVRVLLWDSLRRDINVAVRVGSARAGVREIPVFPCGNRNDGSGVHVLLSPVLVEKMQPCRVKVDTGNKVVVSC